MSTKRRSMAFPPGITVEEATPGGEGELVRIFMRATSPYPVAHQRQKPGGLPPLPPPPGAAHRPTRGHARRRPATVVAADAGNPCQPVSHKAFQARPDHSSEGCAL